VRKYLSNVTVMSRERCSKKNITKNFVRKILMNHVGHLTEVSSMCKLSKRAVILVDDESQYF